MDELKERAFVLAAAERADWQQVVLNGGPPCFAMPALDRGAFCLRAKRWDGHDSMHRYVSLRDLLAGDGRGTE